MRKIRPRVGTVEIRKKIFEGLRIAIGERATQDIRGFNYPEEMYQMRGRPATGSYFPNPWRSASVVGEYSYRSYAPEWGGENPIYDGAMEVIFYKSEEDLIDVPD